MKTKPNRRRWFYVLLVAAVLIAGAVLIYSTGQSSAPGPNLATVRRGDLSASANATGKVNATKTARLSLPAGGMVASIAKHEGDNVNMGEVILSLRPDDAQRRVNQAQLALRSRQLDMARAKAAPLDTDIQVARANLQKATLEVAAAQATYKDNPTAQNDGARQIAQADLDIATANFNRVTMGPTQDELDLLQNAIENAQLDLQTAQQALTQTKLTAPFTSTVTEVDVHAGELVGGFAPLAAVADLTGLEIDADVDEIDVANVQVGQSAQVRFDAFPGQVFTGTITRLFPAASTQRGSTAYGAVASFDAKGTHIRPGMGTNLKILTVEKKGILLVPNRALKAAGTRQSAHVVSPGAPRDVIVETGVSDGNETEIISGLNEGDQVQLQ